MVKRIIGVIIGLTVLGIGSAFCQASALGHNSLNALIFSFVYLFDKPFITYFICYLGLSLIFFIPMLIFDRKAIGIGAALSFFITGLACDGALWLFGKIGLFDLHIALRILFAIIGILLITFGISMYGEASLGISPLDETPRLLIKAIPKLKYIIARIIFDVFCTLVAFIIGFVILKRTDIVSVVTIVSFIVFGPLIGLFSKLVNKIYYHNETAVFK